MPQFGASLTVVTDNTSWGYC